MRSILLLLLIVFGTPPEAGPWPRDKGQGFLSFSTDYDGKNDAFFTTLYAEYGVTSWITAGIDLGFSDDDLYKAIAFGRLPLGSQDGTWKLAIEMGIGTFEDDAVLRPGLHFGRGIKIAKRDGWFTVETLANYAPDPDKVDVTTDITLGLNMSQKHKIILQLQNGNQPMDPDYLNLATSVVVEKTPGLHLELGMKTGLMDHGDIAVKLGLWHSF